MGLKATHFVVLLLHATLLSDICWHCDNGGYLDQLKSAVLAITSLEGIDVASLAVPLGFWLLVAATMMAYLAAGTSDPGFVACDSAAPAAASSAPPSGPLVALAAGAALAGSLAGGRLSQGSERLLPTLDEEAGASLIADAASGGEGESAREVELSAAQGVGTAQKTPGGVTFVYEPDDDEESGGAAAEVNAGTDFRPLADGDSSSLGSEDVSEQDRECKICRLIKPIRAKHCHECGRCVRTHDHHCPWIANCVGEYNRMLFFWFVVLQATEALLVLRQGFTCVTRGNRSHDDVPVPLLLGLLLIGVFSCMLPSLAATHAWLAAVNLTTWEFMRWRRIPYLRHLSPDGGSPFSKSLTSNMLLYCCTGRCLGPCARVRALCGRIANCFGSRCPALARSSLVGWMCGFCRGPPLRLLGPSGEILWQVGPQKVPLALRSQCCDCYFPPGA